MLGNHLNTIHIRPLYRGYYTGVPRPKEKYALFPVTCPKILGSVGRQTFFYKNFFVLKKYENP